MAVTIYEKFKSELIKRDEIKNAPYNPRTITPEAFKRLQNFMDKFGYVSAITWNKRTGHIVGGHQRIAALDRLEKNKEYEITVSVVDVSLEEEKVLNAGLNNDSMQGDWDVIALGEILKESDYVSADFGFTPEDMECMFDGTDYQGLFTDSEDAVKAKADLADIKKHREESTEKMKEEQSSDFFFVVVCESQEQKIRMLKKMGVPDYETYVNSPALSKFLDVEDPSTSEATGVR